MGILFHNEWRTRAIFVTIIVMLSGLFVSRAMLSISIMLFVALTTFNKNFFTQLRSFVRSPLLISIALLFFIPFVSGLWSTDRQTWIEISIIKLPFLLLPISFAGNWQLEERQWKIVGYCFLSLVIIGCIWSSWQYIQDPDAINKSYLAAKTIPTPLENDHVRFSWLVAIAIVCSTYIIFNVKSGKIKILMAVLIGFFTVYIHLLSARTGIIAVYFFFLCMVVYLALQRRKMLAWIIPVALIIILASWRLFPTLQNRVKYVVYDFSFVKNENVTPGTSDANRLLSLKGGWSILQEHPFGVGAGDIRNEMDNWYATIAPGISEHNKLFPSSEWIVYGDIAGWPAFLLFTLIIFLPLFIKKIRHRFFWVMLVAIGISCCILETTLEIQFGIFIYCFILLCWWKWFGNTDDTPARPRHSGGDQMDLQNKETRSNQTQTNSFP